MLSIQIWPGSECSRLLIERNILQSLVSGSSDTLEKWGWQDCSRERKERKNREIKERTLITLAQWKQCHSPWYTADNNCLGNKNLSPTTTRTILFFFIVSSAPAHDFCYQKILYQTHAYFLSKSFFINEMTLNIQINICLSLLIIIISFSGSKMLLNKF